MSRNSSGNLILNLTSKLFQPINVIPPQAIKSSEKLQLAKSQKLMTDLGIIKPSTTGVYHILPLGIRALDKLRNIVKLEMSKLYAQEVKLPFLTDSQLWKKSGRWNNEGLAAFTVKDRHNKELILSPTHEEVAADLIANVSQLSHHVLPLLLYQISTKFRDEIKPRCGLLKSKEFEMKDLYSFDVNIESAKRTYESVASAYNNIFDKIGIPVIRVNADTGDMKGLFSHEYHIQSDLGEDIINSCNDCSYSFNFKNNTGECLNCKSKSISQYKGIEVGHTFLLGSVYSEPLKANFTNSAGKLEPIIMASYGLGITRILSSGIEYLSTDKEIVWPSSIAPYSVVIIPPKGGSLEYELGKTLCSELYFKLNEIPDLFNDVLIDDNEKLTIGKRLLNAKRTGYPIILVLGSKLTENPPTVELIDLKSNEHKYLTVEGIIDYLAQSSRIAPNDTSKKEVYA